MPANTGKKQLPRVDKEITPHRAVTGALTSKSVANCRQRWYEILENIIGPLLSNYWSIAEHISVKLSSNINCQVKDHYCPLIGHYLVVNEYIFSKLASKVAY